MITRIGAFFWRKTPSEFSLKNSCESDCCLVSASWKVSVKQIPS